MANIDPKLTEAIRAAKDRKSGHPTRRVQAVVTLRSDDPSKPLDPAETERSVQSLVDSASKRSNAKPNGLVVFKNLQSFAIDADANLVSDLLDDDGVDSASLNDASC